jgi:PAS domain S-box-containing protein
LGYQSEEVVGIVTPLKFHDPQEVALRAEQLKETHGITSSGVRVFLELASLEGSERGEWSYRHKDGRLIDVELTVTAMREDGVITGFLGIASDISARKRSERKLVQSERKYANFFQLLPNIAGVTRLADGILLEVNASFERWTGWSQQEALGKSTRELRLWEPEVRAQAIERLKESGAVQNFRFEYRTRQGDLRPALMYMTPVEINGEECIYFIIQDVTEATRAQQNLFNERARLHTLLKTIPDLIWLKDPHGVYLSCNARFEAFCGVPEQELVGRTDYDFVPRELADSFRANDLKALALGGPSVNEETVTFASDGHQELLETIKTPMWDGAGKLVGVLGIARNISDLRRAEAEISTSEERYRNLFEQIPAPMVIYRQESLELLAVNQVFLTHYGYQQKEALALKLPQLHPPEERTRLELEIAHSGGNRCLGGEWRHLRKDGSVLDIMAVSHDIAYQGESACIVVITDITQRKQLEEQLRQSQKMESIGRLAGGVAHDFNNMLSVILTSVELARYKLAPGDPVGEFLEMIARAGERSAAITRQLLTFSRQELVSPRTVNLSELAGELKKLLSRLITEEITLVLRAAEELWTVRIDPAQVDQILMNLTVNARDAMPQGGSLVLETGNVRITPEFCRAYPGARAGDFVQLTVSDTGCGMSAETQGHIFEPFFTTKKVGEGTGLGLATVYGIVSQNDGFIHVYSEPGLGSTFKIYLPRVAGEESPAPEAPVEASPAGETILLVEDEELLLRATTQLLENMGYRVIQAGAPLEAQEIAAQPGIEIDVLLTDVVMPRLNGRELAAEVLTRHPSVRVLFMSGYSRDIIAQRGIVEEGMHYIQKPLDSIRLGKKLRELLNG